MSKATSQIPTYLFNLFVAVIKSGIFILLCVVASQLGSNTGDLSCSSTNSGNYLIISQNCQVIPQNTNNTCSSSIFDCVIDPIGVNNMKSIVGLFGFLTAWVGLEAVIEFIKYMSEFNLDRSELLVIYFLGFLSIIVCSVLFGMFRLDLNDVSLLATSCSSNVKLCQEIDISEYSLTYGYAAVGLTISFEVIHLFFVSFIYMYKESLSKSTPNWDGGVGLSSKENKPEEGKL